MIRARRSRAAGSTVALIQARMSSSRFHGKVLAPFAGRPLIDHVIEAVRAVPTVERVTVLTSDHPTDQPLATYLADRGVATFCGPLDDVFERFRQYVQTVENDWFLRVSADSPLLEPAILGRLIAHPDRERAAIVTTTFPRTFPRGKNGELVCTASFLSIDPADLTAEDREHVTPYFYRHPERFVIASVTSSDPGLAALSYAVDTVDDLRRLESEYRAHAERGPR